jgi:hypothetical protein
MAANTEAIRLLREKALAIPDRYEGYRVQALQKLTKVIDLQDEFENERSPAPRQAAVANELQALAIVVTSKQQQEGPEP